MKILIVTPTIGDRETIRRTVASVCEVSKGRIDHVIVCPPSAVSRLEGMGLGNVRIIPEEYTRGVFGAVDEIFRKFGAEYKWIGFLNDDDFFVNGYDRIIKLSENSDSDIIVGAVSFTNIDGVKLYDIPFSRRPEKFSSLIRLNVPCFTQQAVLVRSSRYLNGYSFDLSYKLVSDNHLWSRMSIDGLKFSVVDCLCANYALHDGQLSSDVSLQMRETVRMLKELNIYEFSIKSYFEWIIFIYENRKIYSRRLVGIIVSFWTRWGFPW